MAKTSLNSARDYFEEVVQPAKDQFFRTASTFLNVYAMTTSLYHFHEWLWHYQKAALKAKYPAIQQNGDLWHKVVEVQVQDAGYIRDLNNASKHVELRLGTPSTTMHHSANTYILTSTYGSDGYGTGRHGEASVRLKAASGDVLLDTIAEAVFNFWKTLIDELEPSAPPPVLTVPPNQPPQANS